MANVREKIFITNIEITPEMDNTLKTISMNILLLPHQVLILPQTYFEAMEKDMALKYTIYQPEDLRNLIVSNTLPKISFKSNLDALVRFFKTVITK